MASGYSTIVQAHEAAAARHRAHALGHLASGHANWACGSLRKACRASLRAERLRLPLTTEDRFGRLIGDWMMRNENQLAKAITTDLLFYREDSW